MELTGNIQFTSTRMNVTGTPSDGSPPNINSAIAVPPPYVSSDSADPGLLTLVLPGSAAIPPPEEQPHHSSHSKFIGTRYMNWFKETLGNPPAGPHCRFKPFHTILRFLWGPLVVLRGIVLVIAMTLVGPFYLFLNLMHWAVVQVWKAWKR